VDRHNIFPYFLQTIAVICHYVVCQKQRIDSTGKRSDGKVKRKNNIDEIVAHHNLICKILILVLLGTGITSAQNINRLNGDTLAVIGKRVITLEEFTRRYREKQVRIGFNDNSETRMGYLRNLVDDEILIAQAKIINLDQTPEGTAELKNIRSRELSKAFCEKHIVHNIQITDNDLKKLFVRLNTKIKVRHLYAKTKETSDSLYDELVKGKSFDELAKTTFNDSLLRVNGGLLGYISIDEMDPEFENIAYRMHIGEISKPVKTAQGYSIIKVDDIKENPFMTESEFFKAREKIKGFVRKCKYEEALRQYTATLRKELNIRFDDSSITRLFEMQQQRSLHYLTVYKFSEFSPDDIKKIIVTSTIGKWNINTLIDALSTITPKQEKWIRTEEDFKDIISGIIMNGYISQIAEKEKLNATPSFQENVDYAFNTYLLTTLEKRQKEQIAFSEDSLKSFYLNNKEKFCIPTEIRLSSILVDDVIIADSIKQLLGQGIPFAKLAEQFSIQKLTAIHGGDLGSFRKAELGSFGETLFALKIGQWTELIDNGGKYLFVQCTDCKGISDKSFKEVSKEIEEVLVTMAWSKKRSQYVDSIKENIYCRVNPEILMAEPYEKISPMQAAGY
jgi:parvulin-like peptidyl-prolyl isomerase